MLRRKLRALLLAASLTLPALTAPAQDTNKDAKSAPPAARPTPPAVARALRALTDWVKGREGSVSVRVVDTRTGSVWAEATPELALNPASNMKLLTAAVALSRLGTEFRFSTGLYGRVEKARVESLVLRGHGDPSLGSADLWQLALALQKLGVESVGAILVDQSRFDAQFVPPAFEQQPNEWASFRAPVSAVALERNAVTLNVLATSAGQAARVWFEPPGVVTHEGVIETRRPGSGEAIQLALALRGLDLFAQVSGHVAEGIPRMRFERRLDDPRRAAGLALRALLSDAGIKVSGNVTLGGESIEGRLAFHQSEPLGVLLHELGKNSDNFYAEMVLEALAAEAGSKPATSQAGAAVIKAWLAEHGALAADTRIENGSGLFDANRVSAATLCKTLEVVARDTRLYPEFLAQLAIGGVDGTLRSRFTRLKRERSVRAKTGTLAAAVGLSGYVLRANGEAPIAFSFLVNGIEGHAHSAREKIDKVVEALAAAR